MGFWAELDIQELGSRINTGFAGCRPLDKNVLKNGQKPKFFGQSWISNKYFPPFCPNIFDQAHFSKPKNGQKIPQND